MAIGQMVGRNFFWNLSFPVGTGQPNRADDVELVRFGYVMARAASDVGEFSQQMRNALAALRRTGGFDTDLDAVIRAHEAHKKIAIDGKVSVAAATVQNFGRFDGKHPWIIVNLSNFMRDFDLYPRIDLHPDSGLVISRVVRADLLRR